MLNIRFFVSWIFGALLMFSAFYVWHGVISTDFYRIQYPKGIFLGLAAVVYLIVSFLLYKVFELKFWSKISSNLFLRGLFSGVILGFTLFAFTLVLGVGFSGAYSLKILLVDCLWQLIEQSIGGMVIALAHLFIFVPHVDEDEIRNF